MNRTRFYKKEVVSGVEELDFLNSSLSRLVMKRRPSYYRLNSIDRKRPDIISEKNYGTVYFWWVIMVASGIQDPFFETTIGRIVSVPNILDVSDFAKRHRKNR